MLTRSQSIAWKTAAVLLATLAAQSAGGCNAILGLEPGEAPPDSSGPGTGGQGNGGGPAESCTPLAVEECYSGPEGTKSVGACKAGTQTCRSDGDGFDACEGEVLPTPEVCDASSVDEDCNGFQCSELIWARQFGDDNFQFTEAVVVDAEGSSVVVGSFQGTVDFGGGPLVGDGLADVFVAKISAEGKHLWSKKFGNQGSQTANGVAVDAAGDIFVTGSFDGSINFGGNNLVSAGSSDVFLVKLGPDGAHVWSNRFGDALSQTGRSVAASEDGSVALTGSFQGSINFGGGDLTSAGKNDLFVASFDASGKNRWSKRAGDAASDQYGESVAVDAEGGVIVTGQFSGSVDFGKGAIVSAGDYDIFVAKLLGSDGAAAWSKGFGGPLNQRGQAVAVSPDGTVVVAGNFSSGVDFGTESLANAGATDIFIAKLDAEGVYKWARAFGDASNQFIEGMAVDMDGNILAAGYFAGQLNFGGGPLLSKGGDDMFVAKLTPDGASIWAKSFGDDLDQYAQSIAASASGTVMVAGQINGAVDLGGGPLTTKGNFDIFLARFER